MLCGEWCSWNASEQDTARCSNSRSPANTAFANSMQPPPPSPPMFTSPVCSHHAATCPNAQVVFWVGMPTHVPQPTHVPHVRVGHCTNCSECSRSTLCSTTRPAGVQGGGGGHGTLIVHRAHVPHGQHSSRMRTSALAPPAHTSALPPPRARAHTRRWPCHRHVEIATPTHQTAHSSGPSVAVCCPLRR